MHRPDHAPSLPFDRIPAEEHDAARAIQQALLGLPKYCEDFTAALKLFEYSEMGRAVGLHQTQAAVVATPPWSEVWLSTRWRLIAARDAAHTLAGFASDLDVIQTNLARCPTLASLLGKRGGLPASESGEDLFGSTLLTQDDALAGSGGALTASGHPDPASPVFEEPALYNRSFSTGVGDRRLTYALTAQTESRLEEIRNRLWSAFSEF